jgi:hypothetical protein
MRSAAVGVSFLVVALAGPGCNEPPAREERAPAVTASTLVRPSVAWPDASRLEGRALVALTADGSKTERELRALIARSPVPVLAPRELRLAATSLVVEGEFYALTGRADGATISLQGTRAAHRYEGVQPIAGNRSLRATKGFITVNEGIRSASWLENGAAYSVDVECSDLSDARCQGEEFILSLVAQLAYIGGSGR